MISFKKFSVIKLRTVVVHHAFFEMIVILTTILLAGFLGNYIALLATRQITNELTRFIVGIIIGLLVGIGVGIFIKRIWEKIQQIFIKWHRNKNII